MALFFCRMSPKCRAVVLLASPATTAGLGAGGRWFKSNPRNHAIIQGQATCLALFFCRANSPARPGCRSSCESRKTCGTRGRRSLVQIQPPQPWALRGKTSKRLFYFQLQDNLCHLPFLFQYRRIVPVLQIGNNWEQFAPNRPFNGERGLALCFRRWVRIDLCGHINCGMPQQLPSKLQIPCLIIQNTCCRVSERVKALCT